MGVGVSILCLLNSIIPKKDTILFESYPDFCDNSYALYSYLQANMQEKLSNYKLVWAKKEESDPKSLDCVIIKKKSLKGIWVFLRSRYVISTHGYFSGVKSACGQVQVNLWHGCGYKDMTEEDYAYRGDETIVVSDVYRTIHAKVFKMDPKHVHVTGLPRNDTLLRQFNVLPKLGMKKEGRIYIWMPTYRKASIGHKGIDGSINSFGVSSITDDEIYALNELLKKKHDTLIIKPHPMDSLAVNRIKGYSNIMCLTNKDLNDKGIDLYELLTCTDGLLSDYSSVIIDYLLLDKPIVMVLSDKEEYKNSRGFVFDPVEDYFPGPIISDFSGLLGYFSHAEEIDRKWTQKRHELTTLFHKYVDDKSCERVCNVIWGE